MKRFQNILVAVDSRFEEQPALDWAVSLAERNQAKLKIVDVLPDRSWIEKLATADNDRVQDALAEQKSRKIESIADSVRDRQIDVSTQLLFGRTSFALIHEVLRSGHDLVVRVTRGAHSRRTGFFGTTSMRLLRKCPCPVWLVRSDKPARFERVLVAIDPVPDDAVREVMNSTIMDLGKSVADYQNGHIHVVHAWELFGAHVLKSRYKPGEFDVAKGIAEAGVAAALDSFLAPYQLTHQSDRVHMPCDELGAGHAIAELSKDRRIDLVVMGTIARTGLTGALIGNTAEQVLDRIECSVLAIKPDNFNSPVTLPDE